MLGVGGSPDSYFDLAGYFNDSIVSHILHVSREWHLLLIGSHLSRPIVPKMVQAKGNPEANA